MALERLRYLSRVRFRHENKWVSGTIEGFASMGPMALVRLDDGREVEVIVGALQAEKKDKVKAKAPLCEHCECEPAQVVVTLTSLQGEVLDTVKVCEECRKTPLTFRRDSIEIV